MYHYISDSIIKSEEDIILEYFEPFINENIKLECSYLVKNLDAANIIFFKGYSDQYKQNLIN